MHACLLHMFNNLTELGHHYKMNNLFNLAILARTAYVRKTRALVHEVIRKSGRGLCYAILQDELGGKRVGAVRSTVKAVVLKQDSESHDLIIASYYDQKPLTGFRESTCKKTKAIQTVR